MSILEAERADLNGVDKAYHPLYTQRDGKWLLTGVIGYTPEDRSTIAGTLDKERKAAKESAAAKKAAEAALKPWATIFGDRKAEEIQEELDKIDEYKAAAAGKLDPAQIEEKVNARLKSKTTPLERKVAEAVEMANKAQERIAQYERAEERAAIRAEIQRAALASNALPEAYAEGGGLLALLEGVLTVEVEKDADGNRKLGKVLTKDGAGYPSGLDAAKLLQQVQAKQGYFWAPSRGSGAGNGSGTQFSAGGPNPWEKGKENVTQQMLMINSNPQLAKQFAGAAGVTLPI